jgi:uncharacterized protein (TIGR02453 family)
MAAVPPFSGFGPDALDFLDGLAADNSKLYFDEHRKVYDQQIAMPLKGLVNAVGEALRGGIAPDIDFEPKLGKSMFRINRDLRFAKDKTPYNTHLDAVWWQGETPRTSPGFMMRITATEVLTGVGVFGMSGASLDAFRAALLDDAMGARFDEALASALQALPKAKLSEPQRKRVPKGLPADHQRAEMLKYEQLHVSASAEIPESITSPKFVDWLTDRYAKLVPMHRWLVAHVGD